jgi:hypothetical protein
MVNLSAAGGRSTLNLHSNFANLLSAPGTAQLGSLIAGASAAMVADQFGGVDGGSLQFMGKMVFTPVTAPNVTESGPIGGLSAAASVDIAEVILVNQDTPALTLSLQTPSNPAQVSVVTVVHKGTSAFTMYGVTITPIATPPTSRARFLWDGAAWGGVQ